MSAPYCLAAEVYLMSKLWPIPVLGKTQPVRGATGYDGTVTVEKIVAWLDPDPTRRARAGRGVRMDNIGLRHQLTVAIDVDHGYGEKNGVVQLAKWAEKVGLPPLPATWSSTARGDDSPSRQYVYRIAEDIRFKTKPCPSVELCCWHHRYTVCAPSVHPDTGNLYAWYLPGGAGVPPTWGDRTARYPRADEFAELPAEWLAAFRGSAANADRTAATVAVPDLLATFPVGEPDGLVRYLIEQWSNPEIHVGHDEAKNALIHAFLLGREGHTGVRQLYQVIVDRLAAYLAVARPNLADVEMNGINGKGGLIAACAEIAQQKPINPLPVLEPIVMGVTHRMPTPAEFVAGHDAVPIQAAAATRDEIETWLATYTRYARPDRLGRRVAWMQTEGPHRLQWHARCLVEDTLAGHYPAEHAVRALRDAYRHHGGLDTNVPLSLISAALGAILNAKVSA